MSFRVEQGAEGPRFVLGRGVVQRAVGLVFIAAAPFVLAPKFDEACFLAYRWFVDDPFLLPGLGFFSVASRPLLLLLLLGCVVVAGRVAMTIECSVSLSPTQVQVRVSPPLSFQGLDAPREGLRLRAEPVRTWRVGRWTIRRGGDQVVELQTPDRSVLIANFGTVSGRIELASALRRALPESFRGEAGIPAQYPVPRRHTLSRARLLAYCAALAWWLGAAVEREFVTVDAVERFSMLVSFPFLLFPVVFLGVELIAASYRIEWAAAPGIVTRTRRLGPLRSSREFECDKVVIPKARAIDQGALLLRASKAGTATTLASSANATYLQSLGRWLAREAGVPFEMEATPESSGATPALPEIDTQLQ